MSKREDLKTVKDDTKRLTKYWAPRTDIMKKDRNFRDLDVATSILVDSQISPRIHRVISNHPQAYWDWAVASLANIPFKWEIPKQSLGGEIAADNLELLIYGIDWQLDELMTIRLSEPWRFRLAHQIVGGWYAMFPDIIEDKKGNGVTFMLEFWDAISVFQEYDNKGLTTVLRSYSTTLLNAKNHVESHGETLGTEFKGDDTQTVKVVDHWKRIDDEVFNTYTIDDKQGLPRTKTDRTSIPIITGPVDGYGYESASPNPVQDKVIASLGRSILVTNHRQYQQVNRTKTLQYERMRRTIFANMVDYTKDAQGIIEPGEMDTGESKVFHAEIGEGLQEIQRSAAPLDVRLELEQDQMAIEQGSIPAALFGVNMPTLASGFLENSLEKKAIIRLGRRAVAHKRAAETLMRFYARRLRDIGRDVVLQGDNLKKRGIDGTFMKVFKADEIPESFPVRAKHSLDTPIDKTQAANREIMLKRELVHSSKRAMEETDVENTREEFIQILQEQALMQSVGSAIHAIRALLREADIVEGEGDAEFAQVIRDEAQELRNSAVAAGRQKALGQQQEQPNQSTVPGQEVLPTPLAQGGAVPPPQQTNNRGPVQARPGNQNARR